jgi:Cu/Ag efflux protein CusF
MKKNFALILALFIVFAFASNSIAAKKTGTGKKSMEETTTVTATINKIDLAAKKVVLKDQDGKLWQFVVPSKSAIDLSQYKVGDTVTATGLIDATTGGTILKSFIRKR